MENLKNDFAHDLKKIGDLYEEGKDCLHSMSILADEVEHRDRLYEVLRELRDISEIQLKALHPTV